MKVAGGSQETLPASESEALVSRGISVSSLQLPALACGRIEPELFLFEDTRKVVIETGFFQMSTYQDIGCG